MTVVDDDAPRLRPAEMWTIIALVAAGWGLLALVVWGIVREMT